MKHINEQYLRSSVFGFQDALVSTTGVIAGVSAGTLDRNIVLLAGIVTVSVEAISMAIGEYTSQKVAHEHDKTGKYTDNIYIDTLLMGSSYFLGGMVPLFPIVFLQLPTATYYSIGFAMLGLLLLGYIKAKVVGVNPFKSALEIFILGGFATALGIIVGRIFKV